MSASIAATPDPQVRQTSRPPVTIVTSSDDSIDPIWLDASDESLAFIDLLAEVEARTAARISRATATH